MGSWVQVLVLSVGGALGVNARYWLGVWISRWASPQFPWATFVVNLSGAFVIGVLTVALTRWLPHPHLRLLMITGVLGGYTTFSTFALESATLWERGETLLALANLGGSVALGFAAVLLGLALARAPGVSHLESHEHTARQMRRFHRERPINPAPVDRQGEGEIGRPGREGPT
ncbi:MAG: fluoride efflux transporter CrcB [Isosphaeraceae bacterium]